RGQPVKSGTPLPVPSPSIRVCNRGTRPGSAASIPAASAVPLLSGGDRNIDEGSLAPRPERFIAPVHLRGIDRSARQLRLARWRSPSFEGGRGPAQLQPPAHTGCP